MTKNHNNSLWLDNRESHSLDIRKLISSYENIDGYTIVNCSPATGILFITEENSSFISGLVRMRGRNEGKYPFNNIEMINSIFGYEPNTIEVCSRSVPGGNRGGNCFTVDIRPNVNPNYVADGQDMSSIIEDERFDRWYCEPPYNEENGRYYWDLHKKYNEYVRPQKEPIFGPESEAWTTDKENL